MHKGFELVLNEMDIRSIDRYLIKGEKLYKNQNKITFDIFKHNLLPNGTLDATAIQKKLFKEVDMDCFLSHSHKDEDLAKIIAGYIKEKTGRDTFIDSVIWASAYKLQKLIDDKFSKNKSNQLDYNLCINTGHNVHAMLSTALFNMINSTEYFIFLNTGKSTYKLEFKKEQRTLSPWIYEEINISKILISNKGLGNLKTKLFSNFSYKLDTKHLYKVKTLKELVDII